MQKCLLVSCLFMFCGVGASEKLALDVVSYDFLVQGDLDTINCVRKALYEKGIVGVEGIPEYQEKLANYICAAREFAAMDEECKVMCAPNREAGDTFLGYERGMEKFQRPDGRWVVDDRKSSYYAFVPDHERNKWPVNMDLKTPFEELGAIMSAAGQKVMEQIELTGDKTGIHLEDACHVTRMLHYQKTFDSSPDNPYWCGAHFDHGLFTALTPSFYFVDGEGINEPEEAGLFVRVKDAFLKVPANPNILMFQVGEFGQLVTDDGIRATEHRVHKADGSIERYAMALFFIPDLDTTIHSVSKLTQDARYGENPCSYRNWERKTFERFTVK